MGLAFDPADGWTYVANLAGGSVTILNGTGVVDTVSVGSAPSAPFGVAYDPYNQYVYVSDSSSAQVSVLHGTRVVTNVTVQGEPEGLAVDPGTGYVYVAEFSENNVTVLNGTSVLTVVRVGSGPDGMAYSSTNGDVYVADYGENNVTVVNGTRAVGLIRVGANPAGIAFDPASGYGYVADSGSSQVNQINGLAVQQTFTVGNGPDGVTIDGANGLVYVTNQGDDSVSVLNSTQVLTTIGVGSYPRGDAYDYQNGMVYTADSGSDQVSQISTELGIAPPVVVDGGYQVSASDVAQPLSISALLWGPGAAGDSASFAVTPSPGFGCASGPSSTSVATGTLIAIACTPAAPGTYTLWLNVSDNDGSKVWSTVTVPVAVALVVPAPTFTGRYLNQVAAVDVNESIGIQVMPSGGSGVYQNFQWIGLFGVSCLGLATASPSCEFPATGTYSVSVRVSDSNLATELSPASPIDVYPQPNASLPTANHSSADVGESVRFFESASGGPGSYTYQWLGLDAATCEDPTSASPSCTFASAGVFTITSGVTDGVGTLVFSPPLTFVVLSPPVLATPFANRSSLDVGQSIQFTTSAQGGVGNYTYLWHGLPTSCLHAATPQPVCTAGSPGAWTVWPAVMDGNGGLTESVTTVVVPVFSDPVVAPPHLSATSIPAGGSLTISADVTGGSGGDVFAWSGLPPGCAGRTEVVRCAPSGGGSFSISVTVEDSNNYSVQSAPSNLTVSTGAGLPGGLSTPELAVLVAGVGIALVVAGIVLHRRRKNRPAEPPLLEES